MSTQTELPSFTNLSVELIADSTGALHRNLLDKINSATAIKEEAIAKGLPPAEKKITDAEHKALKAAARIIDLFWRSVHNKPAQKA